MILLLLFAYSPLLAGGIHYLYFQSTSPNESFLVIRMFYALMLTVSALSALLMWRLSSLGQSVFTGIILAFITAQLLSGLSYLTYIIFTFGKVSTTNVLQCCVGFFVLLIFQSAFLIKLSNKAN